MRASTALMVLATTGSSLAAPLEKRANFDAPDGGDTTILKYALTLEYLERKFYQEGIANYSVTQFTEAGFSTDFYNNLKEVYVDEQSHVSLLQTVLGADAPTEPLFAFPSTDAKSFIQLASVLEGVGVSAYLGAAAAIVSKTYLTVAGSILTVEARHSSYIRAALGEAPFPKPYDTPLDFNEVFSLAAQFIVGNVPNLPFKAFPPLALQASQYAYKADRSSVTFHNAYKNAQAANLNSANKPVYAVFFSGLDVTYVLARVTHDDYKIDTIPAGQVGQVYVVLSTADGSDANKIADENILSGVGVLEVIPK